MRVWDVTGGKELQCFHVGSPVNSAVYSPDEKYVLTGSNDRLLRLLDADSGNEVRRFVGHTDQVLSPLLQSRREVRPVRRARPDNAAVGGDQWVQVRCYEAAANLSCVAFSLDGKLALLGGWDRTVRLWDVANWREIMVFNGHTNRVSSVAFSPDGRYGCRAGRTTRSGCGGCPDWGNCG